MQDDSRGAYERFSALLSPLGLPVHCVPGNHDVRDLMRDALLAEPFHYCGTARLGNWLIAGVDSWERRGRVAAVKERLPISEAHDFFEVGAVGVNLLGDGPHRVASVLVDDEALDDIAAFVNEKTAQQ